MNLLSKNITANIIANIWLSILPLLLIPIFINLLGIESYGLIGFYLTLCLIFSILDTGISSAVIREIAWLKARNSEEKKIPHLLRSVELIYWGVLIIFSIGFFAVAWLFGATWFNTKDLSTQVVREAMMLMSISLLAQAPSGLYVGGLMGLQRQVESSGLLTIFGTLRGIGALLVLWKINADIRAFFIWQITISILQTAVVRWFLWRAISIEECTPKFSIQILKSIKGYASGMLLITIFGMIITQIDKMILSRLVTLEIFANYTLAGTLASGLLRISTPLLQAFSPRFTELISRGDTQGLAKQFSIASQLMSVMILPPATLIIFLSNPIITIWLGSDIASDAALILSILAIGVAFSACSYPILSVIYSCHKLKYVLIVNIVFIITCIPLFIIVSTIYGAFGAATINMLYGLLFYLAYQSYGRKIIKFNFKNAIVGDFITPCLVSLLNALIVTQLLYVFEGSVNLFVILGVGIICGCTATLFVCRDLRPIIFEKLKW
jgi:O-antigen/teichoic acid export membrane protein